MARLGADEERRLIADGKELARRLRAEADEIDRLILTLGQGAPSSSRAASNGTFWRASRSLRTSTAASYSSRPRKVKMAG